MQLVLNNCLSRSVLEDQELPPAMVTQVVPWCVLMLVELVNWQELSPSATLAAPMLESMPRYCLLKCYFDLENHFQGFSIY